MLLLVTTGQPDMQRFSDPHLGRLIQPRHTSSVQETHQSGTPWAADNDCFQGLNETKYRAMLKKIAPLDSLKWVTAPDVVGDALATAQRFEEWQPQLAEMGLPIALVLQDGVEYMDRWLDSVWPRIDAVFVGGSTDWKLGPDARHIVGEARWQGKMVHVGRVNSKRRIDYCRDELHADSVDGTMWCRFKNTHLRKGLDWVAGAARPAAAPRPQLTFA